MENLVECEGVFCSSRCVDISDHRSARSPASCPCDCFITAFCHHRSVTIAKKKKKM